MKRLVITLCLISIAFISVKAQEFTLGFQEAGGLTTFIENGHQFSLLGYSFIADDPYATNRFIYTNDPTGGIEIENKIFNLESIMLEWENYQSSSINLTFKGYRNDTLITSLGYSLPGNSNTWTWGVFDFVLEFDG